MRQHGRRERSAFWGIMERSKVDQVGFGKEKLWALLRISSSSLLNGVLSSHLPAQRLTDKVSLFTISRRTLSGLNGCGAFARTKSLCLRLNEEDFGIIKKKVNCANLISSQSRKVFAETTRDERKTIHPGSGMSQRPRPLTSCRASETAEI